MKEIEKWKDIPSYEGFYQASNFGRIKSLDRLVRIKNLKRKLLKFINWLQWLF